MERVCSFIGRFLNVLYSLVAFTEEVSLSLKSLYPEKKVGTFLAKASNEKFSSQLALH